MDYEALKFWADIFWKVGTIATLVWLAIKQQSAVNATAIQKLDERLDDHAERLIHLEERHEASPGYQDLDKIHDRISKCNDALNSLRESAAALHADMKNVVRKIDLLDRHHYGEGGQK